ncbi:MAG TPA: hydrogenase maturation protease [Terriglobales bacterium]|nr:hydrogenase maturation protease [Terriglobales bacterium]
MLIIGCGNRQRGDDAAGILVAERLRELGVETVTRIGQAADLIEAWTGSDDVIVVDAVVTGAPVGTVQMWEGQLPPTCLNATASTHTLGLAEALELAKVLNRLPTRLRVYGIEGVRFEPGLEVSPEVWRAVAEVVRRIIADHKCVIDAGISPGSRSFYPGGAAR